jgi:hypothetical protein
MQPGFKFSRGQSVDFFKRFERLEQLERFEPSLPLAQSNRREE